MNASELLPEGVFLFECRVGDLRNDLPAFWGERPVLADTGLPEEPEAAILPALRARGKDPAQIRIILNSHADMDHSGGNAAMLAACPQARLACSEQDRAMIESPEALWDWRWNQLAADHDLGYAEEYRAMLGPGVRVDWTLRDGDTLNLGGGRTLQALASPGHSFGHLAFVLRPERIAFAFDAVQGQGMSGGGQITPPAYLDPDLYQATLRRIALLKPALLVTCHWGAYRGSDIRAFLNLSRSFVGRVDGLLRDVLGQNPGGLTLKDLSFHLSRSLGLWGAESDVIFAPTVAGHVERAVRQGWACRLSAERPHRFGPAK